MTFRRTRRRRPHSQARYVYRIEHGITIVTASGDIDASNAVSMTRLYH